MDKTYCVIDQVEISEERQMHRAVTCSEDCRKKLKQLRRKPKMDKSCLYCHRPSTPEERKLYKRWRDETFPRPAIGRPKKVKPEEATTEVVH